MKKINSIFFIFLVGLPLIGGAIGTLISYPMIMSGYPEVIFSSVFNVVLSGLVFAFIFGILIVWYINIPYLITIEEDKIIFYRIRKTKIIELKNIDKIEILRKIPAKKHDSSNLVFYKMDGSKTSVVAVPNSIADEIGAFAKRKGISAYEQMRRLTDEEWTPLKGDN